MSDMQPLNDDEISKILHDSNKMTEIIRSGVRNALLEHKLKGNPICEWRDGKVVWIQPEDIKV